MSVLQPLIHELIAEPCLVIDYKIKIGVY